MSNYNISHDQYKNHYGSSYYLPQKIGPGALANDQVRRCKYCRDNGFPNEAITFTRNNGKWRPVNYCDGTPHQHRYRTQQID